MELDQSARGRAEAVVLFSLTPDKVRSLVNLETGVVSDVATGRMNQLERVNRAAIFLRDVVTVVYFYDAAHFFACETVGDAAEKFDAICERAQRFTGFDPTKQIAAWGESRHVSSRPLLQVTDKLIAPAMIHDFAASVILNTDIDSLLQAARAAHRLPEIEDLLNRTRRFVRRSDPFLPQRIKFLATSRGLGLAAIAKAIGLDEHEMPELVQQLGLSNLHHLSADAIPADENDVNDDLLPAEATEAHIRWLEAGAEGPDPCGGSFA